MRKKILEFVRSGNAEGLKTFLTQNLENINAPELLHSDDSLISEIILDIYGPLLIHSGDVSASPNKTVIEGMEVAMQLLIVFGAKRPQGRDFTKQIEDTFDQVDVICQIINFKAHALKEDRCLNEYLLTFLTSNELDSFLRYAKANPSLNNITITKEFNEAVNKIRTEIRKFEQHKVSRNLIPYFENQIKCDLRKEKGFDMSRIRLGAHLAECCCNGHERVVREKLEKVFINEALQRFPANKIETLRVLSLGSGELLQDFIIVIKLLTAGYKNIQLFIIEPHLRKDIFSYFQAVINDMAEEVNATVTMIQYPSIQNYRRANPENQLHLVNAIDFENIFKRAVFADIIYTYKLLTDDGYFLFSYDEFKLALTPKVITLLDECSSANTLTSKFGPVFSAAKLKKQALSIALTRTDLLMETWLSILPKLCQPSVESLSIYMLKPREQGYFGGYSDTANEGFNQADIEYFLQRCVGQQIQIFVNLLDSQDDVLRAQPSGGFDAVFQLGLISNKIDMLYAELSKVPQVAPNAIHICFAQLRTENFCYQISEGVADALPSKEQLQEKIKVNEQLFTIMTKINEHIETLSKDSFSARFNSQQIKANRLRDALRRIVPVIFDDIQQNNSPQISTNVVKMFTAEVDGNESLLSAYNFNPYLVSSCSDTIDISSFISNEFGINIETDANIDKGCMIL